MPPATHTPEKSNRPVEFDIAPLKAWDHYSPQDRADIEEISEWQQSQSPPLTDARFIVGSGYTQSTWSKLKAGKYLGNVPEAVAVFRRHVMRLADARAAAKAAPATKFYETTDLVQLQDAIKAANAEAQIGGQDRLVCYVADFGGGKTTLAKRLCDDNHGVLIEATPSWRNSYFAACQSIAESVGIKRQFRGAGDAEQNLINHLKIKPRMLFFEEIEYTGTSLLNLWKILLNQTECVIVIFFITKFFHDVRRKGGEYADQLLRRADVIVAEKIRGALALKFLAEHWTVSDELKIAAAKMAEAANKKGGLHLCTKVASNLAKEFRNNGTPTLADVECAIDAYRDRHQYTAARV